MDTTQKRTRNVDPTPDPPLEYVLTQLLNKYSQENASDTPDWILAQYLLGCLQVWNNCVPQRDQWYGFKLPKERSAATSGY